MLATAGQQIVLNQRQLCLDAESLPLTTCQNLQDTFVRTRQADTARLQKLQLIALHQQHTGM